MGTKIKTRRIFSEQLKRKLVNELETGSLQVKDVCEIYQVSHTAVYKWLYKHSKIYKRNNVVIVEDKSESKKAKLLEQQVKELQRTLGEKQMQVEYLEKLLELHKEATGEDLKKKGE